MSCLDPMPWANGQTTPLGRMWNALGRKLNMDPLVLADEKLNSVKRAIWSDGTSIRSNKTMNNILRQGTNGAFTRFVSEIRNPVTALQFLVDNEMRTWIRGAYRMHREEMLWFNRMAENANYRNPNLHHMLDRFMRDHIETSIRIVRRIVRRYSDLGHAAIRGSGV